MITDKFSVRTYEEAFCEEKEENGYYRYVCKIGNFERICRGKDIELI